MKKQHPIQKGENRPDEQGDDLPGYPPYPKNEDIYSQFKEEQDIDPEDPTKTKEPLPEEEPFIDIEESEEDLMGTDLDVPGADLDDDMESIGNEDEENNYYSIGGDNHNNLEEDQGEEFP